LWQALTISIPRAEPLIRAMLDPRFSKILANIF